MKEGIKKVSFDINGGMHEHVSQESTKAKEGVQRLACFTGQVRKPSPEFKDLQRHP